MKESMIWRYCSTVFNSFGNANSISLYLRLPTPSYSRFMYSKIFVAVSLANFVRSAEKSHRTRLLHSLVGSPTSPDSSIRDCFRLSRCRTGLRIWAFTDTYKFSSANFLRLLAADNEAIHKCNPRRVSIDDIKANNPALRQTAVPVFLEVWHSQSESVGRNF